MEVRFSQHIAPAAAVEMELTADFIAGLQKPSGEIPWSKGGKTDPWDHVESAMGLAVAGRLAEAKKAYGDRKSTRLNSSHYRSSRMPSSA